MPWSILQFIQVPSTSGKIALVVLNLFLTAQQVSSSADEVFVPEHITAAQRSMVQQLSGAEPIQPGVLLSSRSTPAERQIVADYLYTSLLEAGLNAQRHEYKASHKLAVLDLFFNPSTGTNVYAIIPATIPSDEYVILGAHYDSEPGSPGASDNATGVAMMYQVALQLNKLDSRRRNFIVVFFDQEEDDLVGSKAFVRKWMKEEGRLHSAHTADMVGWDADGDGAIELEYPSTKLRALYQPIGDQLGIQLHETKVTSTDHEAFREQGYEAVGITEEYVNDDSTPHYHQPTDTADTVNYPFLLNATRLVWLAMRQLAVNP